MTPKLVLCFRRSKDFSQNSNTNWFHKVRNDFHTFPNPKNWVYSHKILDSLSRNHNLLYYQRHWKSGLYISNWKQSVSDIHSLIYLGFHRILRRTRWLKNFYKNWYTYPHKWLGSKIFYRTRSKHEYPLKFHLKVLSWNCPDFPIRLCNPKLLSSI